MTLNQRLGAAFADIQDGVRFIRHQPLILSTMILDFIATFFSSANTLLPYFSQNILHVGEVAYGWLAAAQSIGAVIVGLVASQYNRIRRQGPLLIGAVSQAFGLAVGFVGCGVLGLLSLLLLFMRKPVQRSGST